MALREFTDPEGVHWKIWQVTPTARYAPPAHANERRTRQVSGVAIDRRKRLSLTPGLENGWLCFESEGEKRRLTPVPAGWESCADDVLASYLRRAERVHRRVLDRPVETATEPPAAAS